MKELCIVANLIEYWTEKKPDLEVLTFVNINGKGQFIEEKRTYQQLWNNGQKLAKWLKNKGLKKGDSFALVIENHPEFIDFMVASSILGTIFVPIDPRTKGNNLDYMLNFSDCKGAIVADYSIDNVADIFKDTTQWLLPLTSDEESVATVLSSYLVAPELVIESNDINAPMQMLFTSGTTGDPKAILSPHHRFGIAEGIAKLLGLTEKDRPYTGLSLTHANAQLVTLGTILTLALPGVISRKFTKSRLWDITREYGCTWFNLLGGMTTAIFADPVKENDADNPVRIVLSAGMPAAIWNEFKQRFGVEVSEFYGAAEGGLSFNVNSKGPVGSCGKAAPSMKMAILDDNDNECSQGEAGEICYRNVDNTSPVVNYFKNPEASKKKTRGGWLRMGDIGHIDEDGWLFFHYRKGGGIRLNGSFINPALVEKFLSELEEVDDVFVYGIPSRNGVPGEKEVVAAIVPINPLTFNCGDVFKQAKEKLESSFVPHFIQLVDEIPKTASEKPIERFLIEAFDINAKNIKQLSSY